MREALIDIAVATLGRAPSPSELAQWEVEFNAGALSMGQLAADLLTSDEGQARFPAADSNVALLTNAYQVLFGREPDTEGMNYWLAQLEEGNIEAGTLVAVLLEGARAETGNPNDAALANARADAASTYLAQVEAGEAEYDADAAAAAVSAVSRGDVADPNLEFGPDDIFDPDADPGDDDDSGDTGGDTGGGGGVVPPPVVPSTPTFGVTEESAYQPLVEAQPAQLVIDLGNLDLDSTFTVTYLSVTVDGAEEAVTLVDGTYGDSAEFLDALNGVLEDVASAAIPTEGDNAGKLVIITESTGVGASLTVDAFSYSVEAQDNVELVGTEPLTAEGAKEQVGEQALENVASDINAADEGVDADVDADRTVDLAGTEVVVGATYTVNIGEDAFNYEAAEDDTLEDIVSELAGLIEADESYSAAVNGDTATQIDITEGAGTAEIDVAATPAEPEDVTVAGNINEADEGVDADVDADRTVDLAGTEVVVGATYTVNIGEDAFNYEAAEDDTLEHIVSELAGLIEADESYSAAVNGDTATQIDITEGAGTAEIDVAATPAEPEDVTVAGNINEADEGVDADVDADRTVDLAGTEVVVGATYTVNIGEDAFNYEAAEDDTLEHIVSELAGLIEADESYSAAVNGDTATQIDITEGAGTAEIEVAATQPVFEDLPAVLAVELTGIVDADSELTIDSFVLSDAQGEIVNLEHQAYDNLDAFVTALNVALDDNGTAEIPTEGENAGKLVITSAAEGEEVGLSLSAFTYTVGEQAVDLVADEALSAQGEAEISEEFWSATFDIENLEAGESYDFSLSLKDGEDKDVVLDFTVEGYEDLGSIIEAFNALEGEATFDLFTASEEGGELKIEADEAGDYSIQTELVGVAVAELDEGGIPG